jgi:hypothetical protein
MRPAIGFVLCAPQLPTTDVGSGFEASKQALAEVGVLIDEKQFYGEDVASISSFLRKNSIKLMD